MQPIRHPALPSAEWMSILGVSPHGDRVEPAGPGGGLRQRLQLLLDVALLRQELHPVPRLREGALRDRLPGRRRAGHGQLLRHGRELPQGPRPGARAARRRWSATGGFSVSTSSRPQRRSPAFGIDNLVRLGVDLVWIGFESRSRQSAFAKNLGIDARKLVRDLRDRGHRGARLRNPLHGAPHARTTCRRTSIFWSASSPTSCSSCS